MKKYTNPSFEIVELIVQDMMLTSDKADGIVFGEELWD